MPSFACVTCSHNPIYLANTNKFCTKNKEWLCSLHFETLALLRVILKQKLLTAEVFLVATRARGRKTNGFLNKLFFLFLDLMVFNGFYGYLGFHIES